LKNRPEKNQLISIGDVEINLRNDWLGVSFSICRSLYEHPNRMMVDGRDNRIERLNRHTENRNINRISIANATFANRRSVVSGK
jgi:hypothetical protein